jgi:lauroyl/myristoyl acyltransferase
MMSQTVATTEKGDATPAVSAKDIYELPRLAVQGVLAWTLPETAWWPLSRLFGRVNAATHPTRTGEDASRIASVLAGSPHAAHARKIAAEVWANRYEERFQYLRAWRPGGWTPSIDISGAEHVDAARARGRGVLFWGSNFSFNDLVTKMAWHRLGLRVSHFSRPIHGFSKTHFGIRYLNAVRRRVEDRFLGERIMAAEHETRSALDRLRRRLEANEAISFTVGERGRRRATAKFRGANIVLATGPLFMAQSTGASVVPVFTLRTAPNHFEVTFGRPIELPARSTADPDFTAAAQEYADRLLPYVLKYPGQWKGWRFVTGAEKLRHDPREHR